MEEKMEDYQEISEQQAIDPSVQEASELKEDEQFLNQDVQDSGIVSYSEPKQIGGVYALFQEVLTQPRTTKVANLDKHELGNLDLTVRDSMKIALIADTFHHPTFSKFFADQAEIISASSMAKKGWFTELFVTSKKFAQRDSSSSVNLPQQQKKWSLFSNNQPQQ
jgi:hypothetical protein